MLSFIVSEDVAVSSFIHVVSDVSFYLFKVFFPVVTNTLARFFSFHPFQNVFFVVFFCRFKTKLGPFSKHPSIFSLEHHVGAEVAETGYFSRSTRKRFLFHVFHSSTFDDIYSSRGGETFFSFSIILLVLLNNSSYIYFEVQRSIF